MNDLQPSIQVRELRKRYRTGWFRGSVDALRGVTFQVDKGQIFGLLGPNGAGKTTIIKILLGIVHASGGVARLLGKSAGNPSSRRRIGYLPENLQFPKHQHAESALEFYGRLSGLDATTIRRRGGELLERVGLADRKRESVQQYSKGMRQRLGLAQAILHDPELLILDEPTDGLDPVGRTQVRDLLMELSQDGRTVFLNSHLLQEVEMVCSHVAILSRGDLKYVGSLNAPPSPDEPSAEDARLEIIIRGRVPSPRNEHIVQQSQLGAERTQLSVRVSDQTQLDQLVDQLRDQDLSIESMSPKRRTLEDLFLQVVQET